MAVFRSVFFANKTLYQRYYFNKTISAPYLTHTVLKIFTNEYFNSTFNSSNFSPVKRLRMVSNEIDENSLLESFNANTLNNLAHNILNDFSKVNEQEKSMFVQEFIIDSVQISEIESKNKLFNEMIFMAEETFFRELLMLLTRSQLESFLMSSVAPNICLKLYETASKEQKRYISIITLNNLKNFVIFSSQQASLIIEIFKFIHPRTRLHCFKHIGHNLVGNKDLVASTLGACIEVLVESNPAILNTVEFKNILAKIANNRDELTVLALLKTINNSKSIPQKVQLDILCTSERSLFTRKDLTLYTNLIAREGNIFQVNAAIISLTEAFTATPEIHKLKLLTSCLVRYTEKHMDTSMSARVIVFFEQNYNVLMTDSQYFNEFTKQMDFMLRARKHPICSSILNLVFQNMCSSMPELYFANTITLLQLSLSSKALHSDLRMDLFLKLSLDLNLENKMQASACLILNNLVQSECFLSDTTEIIKRFTHNPEDMYRIVQNYKKSGVNILATVLVANLQHTNTVDVGLDIVNYEKQSLLLEHNTVIIPFYAEFLAFLQSYPQEDDICFGLTIAIRKLHRKVSSKILKDFVKCFETVDPSSHLLLRKVYGDLKSSSSKNFNFSK